MGRVVHGRRHVRLLHHLGGLPLDDHILAARPRPCLRRDVARLARFGAPLVIAITGWRLRIAIEALVVGRVLSTSALGFFRYGQRIAQIPQMGIVEVGGTSLFPAFSRIAGDRERFAAAYLRALHWSMVGAAAGTGLMIAAG